MQRSSVTRLPAADRLFVDEWLRQHDGGDLVELAAQLAARGANASKSALQRYAMRRRPIGRGEILRLIRRAVRMELADAGLVPGVREQNRRRSWT